MVMLACAVLAKASEEARQIARTAVLAMVVVTAASP
jgi:hypothetical protein